MPRTESTTTQDGPTKYKNANLPLFLALGMAAATAGLIIWLKLVSPTEPPFPQNLTDGEKIANAIATPPQPVPEWLSFLYPWQTLLSADLALMAALVGAWAIMAQVQGSLTTAYAQIQAARESLRTQIEAARADINTQIQAAREDELARLKHEREVQRGQALEHRNRIAGAIAAELASWMNRFGNYRLLRLYKDALNQNRNVVQLPPIQGVDHFPVFGAVCDSLGSFESPLPEQVVGSYGALRGVLDIFHDVRTQAPLPPLDKSKATYEEVAERRQLEQARERESRVALNNLIGELGILDNMGRQAIEGLARISGTGPPEVPLWS
jgi:hypothetical protein